VRWVKHSTKLAVLEFVDRIYGHLDNNKTPISVFIDLSKAFDMIDHNILCHKLHFYGVLDTNLKWFKNYLTNRQCTISTPSGNSGPKIEKVASFKLLGITLDTNLNWNSHMTEHGNKLSRTNGVLSRLKNFILSSILMTIYNALFLSHLNYGITCWGFNSCSRITHLQKRAIRNVTKSKYNAHTEPLFRLLNTPKLEDTFKLSCLKIYYNYSTNSLPAYFSNLPFNNAQNNNHQINTRPRRTRLPTERYKNSQSILPNLNPTISIVSTKKILSRQCIRHYIPQLINDKYLPECSLEKVHTHSQKGFNTYAKNKVIQRYSVSRNISDCYICKRPSITT
jgi:hypothetical protein